QQLAPGEVPRRPEEDDHLVVGDRLACLPVAHGRSLCCHSMGTGRTQNGVGFDSVALDRVDRRFWREIWESVPAEIATEHGIEVREFGRIQATVARDLGQVGMLNLVLGAAEASEQADLEAAIEWAEERSTPYVSVTPGLPGSVAAEEWLRGQ